MIQPPDFDSDWHVVRGLASAPVRDKVCSVVLQHATALADLFYAAMFADREATFLLDRAEVDARLKASMRRWIVQLFDPASTPQALSETQRRTGEVHARIGVPMVLVARGGRVLKQALVGHLAEAALERSLLLQAALYIQELITLAVDTMASAFSANLNRIERSEEAYRLFFLGQDMKAERERRRSELLEWAHQILDRYYWASGDDDQPQAVHPQDVQSQFTLWLHHKAAMLFEGAAEVELIRADMARVERELLPQLSQARSSRADARPIVGEIHRAIGRIKDLLGAMFDRYLAVEDGRDGVTALLNRRYFPAIARREIEVAQSQQGSFTVLVVDIDGFLPLLEAQGEEAGNAVLAQTATLLQAHLRAGDFVFRTGAAEFLLLLVECLPDAAQRGAEGLRHRFHDSHLDGRPGSRARLTLSIGIAPYDGHPDYQRLLDRADAALARARADGGNCWRQAG